MNDRITSPNAARARHQNRAMQDQLLASLDYLTGECAASGLFDLSSYASWRARIVESRARPCCFGAYYDLVTAIDRGRKRQIAALLEEIVHSEPAEASISIIRLGNDCTKRETRRIRRFMGGAGTGASGVRRPKSGLAVAFEQTLREALDWIDRRTPELAEEIDATIREIILVGPDRLGRGAFEGGTSFKLTGALVLNAERDVSVSDLVLTLAHEAGHAVLFGECIDEMLVQNPDTELYWSPIRQAKRPLEGIFHAGFVSGRMLWALDHMDKDSGFSLHEQIDMTTARAEASEVFAECVSIIGQNARLTGTGKRILDDMRDALKNRSPSKPSFQVAS
ncbi:MAG: HEXXH motif-containing putative peptide modification protein [Pseudomonadota bacterium]